jgi:sirohydrochlorin ferrochelatase
LNEAVVIFAHGSSVESANDAVRAVAAEAARLGNFRDHEVAFLDFPPKLEEAVGRLTARGASGIVIVPYFLTLGIHLQRDLPALLARLEAEHPGVRIEVTPPLDGHAALAGIVADRVRGR